MLRRTLCLVFAILLLLLGTKIVLAENEFSVDASVEYKVDSSGKTLVTHDITVENNFSTLYATTYTLTLENIDVENARAYNQEGDTYELETQKEGDLTKVKIKFNDAVVGKGKQRHFFVSYDNSKFAVKTGEVWEVSIPRLSEENSFRSYTVNLFVPDSFGLEAYISPSPDEYENIDSFKHYRFHKSDITQAGITAGFGEFQVFTFSLAYHLENPLGKSSETQIALPPDTAFQKIYFSKITPEPSDVTIDPDGNWIATYRLSPRERVDVMVTGSVQIFASFRHFPAPTPETLSNNLKETMYWQVNDAKIKSLAQELKTPKAIYDYVTTTLSYNYERVRPNVQRFGAIEALKNPSQAICMEFTDLFIALARAAGIPAREINGYAYTENPELQPLSLVADVLHSWPEYYDSEKAAWIPVDPTWGSTTGGQDFFTKLDLRHFTFVIHGTDSTKPYPPGSYKLGTNPQKDVFVSFGKLPEARISTPILSYSPKRLIPFLDSIYSLKIFNPGPASLTPLYSTIYFDGKEESRDFVAYLPPYATYKSDLTVPFSLLGKDTPDRVRIVADGAQIEIATNKTQVIINSLLSIFVLFLAIILGILFKLGKIRINLNSIRSNVKKFIAKFTRNSGGIPIQKG